jgi:DNA-binding response OmpR family regulator
MDMTSQQQVQLKNQPQSDEPKKTIMPRIMIIDDDPELLDELKEALSFQNYEVEAISNSAQAFDKAYELKPDLIILDIKMSPKTGFQLANEFRNSLETKYIPIIAITGFFVEKEHLLMMKVFGMKHVILKPFNLPELIEKVETALKESKPHWA